MRVLHNPKTTTRALIVTVLGTWLAAGVLAWVLPPQLVVHSALAQGDAAEIANVLGVFALIVAGVGAVELIGLAVVLWRPRLIAGRLVVLSAGLVLAIGGLFLLNGGALQSPEVEWSPAAAIPGLSVVAVFVATGALACAAALFSRLPGASMAERMTVQGEAALGAPRRQLVLVLTAALVVAWISTMATLLRTHGAESFDAMQFLMPLLAGALAGVWRAGKPNRLATLGLASGAGAVSGWLFLLTMMLGQYYRFTPVAYVFWWGLTGAVLGALGYGVWLLGRRFLRPRRSPATAAHAH